MKPEKSFMHKAIAWEKLNTEEGIKKRQQQCYDVKKAALKICF